MLYLRVSDGLVPIGNMNEAEAAFKSAGSNKIETESFDGYTAGVGTSMHEKAFLVPSSKAFTGSTIMDTAEGSSFRTDIRAHHNPASA